MEGASVSVKIALSFPLVNLILDYLAIRNIGADEALVRSLDRLRLRLFRINHWVKDIR